MLRHGQVEVQHFTHLPL